MGLRALSAPDGPHELSYPDNPRDAGDDRVSILLLGQHLATSVTTKLTSWGPDNF